MSTQTLAAEPRTITGRKVKKLRREGTIPASVYGKKTKSIAVAVSAEAFAKVYGASGETGLVTLTVGKDERPVLVHSIQRDPVSGELLHIEFLQVDLKEKIRTEVPLEFAGQAPAEKEGIGVILTQQDHVEVEALPSEIPDRITVDMGPLALVGDSIKVANIQAPAGVLILTEPETVLVQVSALTKEEEPAPAAAPEAEAQEEAAAGEETSEGKKEEQPGGEDKSS